MRTGENLRVIYFADVGGADNPREPRQAGLFLTEGCKQDTVVSRHAQGMCLNYSRCLADLLAAVAGTLS